MCAKLRAGYEQIQTAPHPYNGRDLCKSNRIAPRRWCASKSRTERHRTELWQEIQTTESSPANRLTVVSRSTGSPRKKPCELMQQQSAGDAGDIDRAFRSAASLLRLGSREQRGAVVTPSYRIGDCQDPNHFPQHPAIGPKNGNGAGPFARWRPACQSNRHSKRLHPRLPASVGSGPQPTPH